MRRQHPLTIVLAYLTLFFLYLPLLGVAIFSINDASRGLVWKGFTLKWYVMLFHNARISRDCLEFPGAGGFLHAHRHSSGNHPGHCHEPFPVASRNR